jgi:putative acetyltransferase
VAVKPERVGRYPALVKSGGGFVWDEVLEYRVWCCPHRGADDLEDGNDYFFAFATYPRALAFSQKTRGADEPIALIRQKEYIDEPRTGQYVHVKKVRLTEWPVEFLECPRRGRHTIPDFLAPDAPANRLDIMRGLARNPRSAATARKTRPRPTRRTLH